MKRLHNNKARKFLAFFCFPPDMISTERIGTFILATLATQQEMSKYCGPSLRNSRIGALHTGPLSDKTRFQDKGSCFYRPVFLPLPIYSLLSHPVLFPPCLSPVRGTEEQCNFPKCILLHFEAKNTSFMVCYETHTDL